MKECNNCNDQIINCSCKEKVSFICSFYDGETLYNIDISKGDNGEQILRSINTIIGNLDERVENAEIGNFHIENVGNGLFLFKPSTIDGIHEMKSLLSSNSIDINDLGDELEIVINEDWLNTNIETYFKDNFTSTIIEFKWSSKPTKPSEPDQTIIDWHDNYMDGDIWMAMREIINDNTSTWKVIKIKGEKGDKGDKGDSGTPSNSSFNSIVFTRSSNKPSTPTTGSYFNPIPSGWSAGIPIENGDPAWMTSRVFSENGGSPQQPTWSEPVKVTDNSTIEIRFSSFTGTHPGTPTNPLNGATWHSLGEEDDIWMASRIITNGSTSPWSVVRIKGYDGDNGQTGPSGISSFTSIVFKRSPDNTPITTAPTGGSYSSPIPSGWSDGIPSGVGVVYQSSRIFSSTGAAPQQATWSQPVIAVDTQYKDYEYSHQLAKPDNPTIAPSLWHNEPDENDIWQAVRDNDNGVYGDWVIQRIKGEQGSSGMGYTVISDNPVETLAVGSDSTTSSLRTFKISISVYRNSDQLTPKITGPLTSTDYMINIPTISKSGVTVVRGTADELIFTVASGTNFATTLTIPITVIIGNENVEMVSSFSIVPIMTAEDSQSLEIRSDYRTVKFDGTDNLISPDNIQLRAVLQNYNETVTWSSTPVGKISGTGLTKVLTTSGLFTGNESLVKIKIETPNGLYDEIDIVKVRDGSQGPPGLIGTTGPSPRTFEWVPGATYQIGEGFIDYAYYRGNTEGDDPNRGWYVVKLAPGESYNDFITTAKKKIANLTGSPDANFEKVPFSETMTFGTIIAEQANLAGFIFRNQLLTSQQKSLIDECHPLYPTTPDHILPNLTINGREGVIKFLERFVMNKDGMTFNDKCGKPRIKFALDISGTPILQFLNEDGTVYWEAGKNGYQIITTGTQPSTWRSFKITKIVGLNSYNESSAITQTDSETSLEVLMPSIKSTIETELSTLYSISQIDCSGPTTTKTPYILVWDTNAFKNLYHEFIKGDMAADMNKYAAIYSNQVTVLESEVSTAPVGTFPENGWYFIEHDTGENRNNPTVCSATKGVYPLFESVPGSHTDPMINGYAVIRFGYIKNGRIIRDINIVEKRTWEK